MTPDLADGVGAGDINLVLRSQGGASVGADGGLAVTGAAVVFDLDGVLADSHHAWVDAERRAVEELGGRWRPPAAGTAQGTAPGVASAELAVRCGLDGRHDAVDAATRRHAVLRFPGLVRPVPGAERFVAAAAAAARVAVATNAARPIAEVTLRSIGLAGLLDVLVSADDVPEGKPAPDVYLAAAALVGVDPDRCIAFDDTVTGLRAAVGAGMCTFAFGAPAGAPAGIAGTIGSWADVEVVTAA